jgi:hypothetical protein
MPNIVPNIVPYSDGDRLKEPEMAKKIGKTVRALRDRRAKGTSSPWTTDGKDVIYSWIKYLQHLEQNERGPVRARRRTPQSA